MAKLISEPNAVAAWKSACSVLMGEGQLDNLILEFPFSDVDQLGWTTFNPSHIGAEHDDIRDVANTIFPEKTFRNANGRTELYSRYLRAHERRRRRFPGVWGTYFLRLISFGKTEVNQLERAIQSASAWQKNHRAVIVFHISSPETDSIRMRGGPCLQYLQLLCPDKESLELSAVYRSHDYFNKALGNFVGLSRLLNFVGLEIGRAPTKITCHSTHAFLGSSKSNVENLLSL